jgi:hypothetical protein
VRVVTEKLRSRRVGIGGDDWDTCGESDSCDRKVCSRGIGIERDNCDREASLCENKHRR